MIPRQSDPPRFRTEIAPEIGFLSWLLQQIAAPLPLVLWALLVNAIEEAVARNGFDLFLYLPAGWTLSFFFAVLIRRIVPEAEAAGRRIWMIAVSLLALAFGVEAIGISFGRAFSDLFYPGSDGESQGAFVMMTCPTISAIAYSPGMIWSARRQASKAAATRNSGPGDASGVTVSSAP
jgi:hypothetical protein